MESLNIRRCAGEGDAAAVEAILLEAVEWLNARGTPLWRADEIRWPALARRFRIEDFFIASVDGADAGCMALVDYDPDVWPGVPRGEGLFLHKLAVRRAYAGGGLSCALLNYAKALCAQLGVDALRLDAHAARPSLRALYERNGFVLIEEKILFGKFDMALYEYRL